MENENKLTWNNLPEIVKRALTAVAAEQNFITYKVDITSGTNANDGFLSEIVRATIVGSKSSEESIEIQEEILHEFSVLCKMQVTSQARRDFSNSSEVFKREISLYNDYLRELVKLQQEFGISEEEGFFNFPKCYYAEYDDATDDGILVMNDIRDSGFMMASKYELLDIQSIRLVVQKLAKLHALSFVFERKKPEMFKNFKKYDDLMFKILMKPATMEIWNTVFPLAITSLQQEHPKIAEKVQNLHENFYAECEKLSNTENSGKYTVIGHGDCWNNNFMYKYGPTGTAQEVMLLDWQLSKYGSPIIDLVYFLFTATDKEARDAYYDDLLKLYHGSMSSLMQKFGESVENIFPIAVFHEELKKFGKFGLIIALFNLNVVTIPEEESPNVDESIEKLMNPDKRCDSDISMIKAIKTNNPKVAPRLKDIVLDIDRFGYL
ncbi:uncharacterized protein LOC134828071 [Culicoides brevitarsis]|uniref:uncharacterized protein LOC134828071 n=1 Tax=Culicoides brevitarsis TaxID=469753 RepID=UPI00307BDA4F